MAWEPEFHPRVRVHGLDDQSESRGECLRIIEKFESKKTQFWGTLSAWPVQRGKCFLIT